MSDNNFDFKHEINGNEDKGSEGLDIEKIYEKIAPYLSDPDFIKQFLNQCLKLTIKELKLKIEKELNTVEPIRCTDLRILLNSL